MTAWRDGFHAALYGYVLEHGGLVKEKLPGYRSYGGWRDYSDVDWSNGGKLLYLPDSPTGHMLACGINYSKSSYADSEWESFSGTFAEPPWERETGLDVSLTCTCGKVSRKWRHQGSYADLIKALTGG